MRGAVVWALGLTAVWASGCSRPVARDTAPRPFSPTTASREVRYNAVLALAHRGSERVKDEGAWEVLVAMLNEDEQLRNFRTKLRDGRETTDETAARMTVIGALRAVQELHRKQPKMDLSGLKEPIEKLTHSPAGPVSTEAQQTLQALATPA
jgi:hypothetical protein